MEDVKIKGTDAWRRYERFCSAKAIEQASALGLAICDLKHGLEKGHLRMHGFRGFDKSVVAKIIIYPKGYTNPAQYHLAGNLGFQLRIK